MKKIIIYIRSDYHRYYGRGNCSFIKIVLSALRCGNHCFAYSFWLRLASEKNNIFYILAMRMHKRLSKKYGIQIDPKTSIGYGLYIGHGIGIVINETAVIGNNCNLSQFMTIGSNEGNSAIIGDNVYIGPSVCIVENVQIGDNVSIGAGAVVVKDIPDNATVAGVPAKIISFKNPGRFICRRWDTF